MHPPAVTQKLIRCMSSSKLWRVARCDLRFCVYCTPEEEKFAVELAPLCCNDRINCVCTS